MNMSPIRRCDFGSRASSLPGFAGTSHMLRPFVFSVTVMSRKRMRAARYAKMEPKLTLPFSVTGDAQSGAYSLETSFFLFLPFFCQEGHFWKRFETKKRFFRVAQKTQIRAALQELLESLPCFDAIRSKKSLRCKKYRRYGIKERYDKEKSV